MGRGGANKAAEAAGRILYPYSGLMGLYRSPVGCNGAVSQGNRGSPPFFAGFPGSPALSIRPLFCAPPKGAGGGGIFRAPAPTSGLELVFQDSGTRAITQRPPKAAWP